VCVYRLKYPACNAQVHLWSVCLSVCLSVCPSVCLSVCLSVRPSVRPSVRLSVCPSVRPAVRYFFPLYLIKGAIFIQKLPNLNCTVWFSQLPLPKTLVILRRIDRDMVKNVNFLLRFSNSTTKGRENPLFHAQEQTAERRDVSSSHFSQFCGRA
jgi:hypothetical protein